MARGRAKRAKRALGSIRKYNRSGGLGGALGTRNNRLRKRGKSTSMFFRF